MMFCFSVFYTVKIKSFDKILYTRTVPIVLQIFISRTRKWLSSIIAWLYIFLKFLKVAAGITRPLHLSRFIFFYVYNYLTKWLGIFY